MDLRTLLLFLGCVLMSATLYYFGFKFLKKKNYCLGWEWLILASSAANYGFYWLTFSETSYDLVIYLDTFSRAFGMVPIAVLGMLAVTHRYEPPFSVDIWLYASTLVATAIILYLDFMEPILPYFLLIAWYVFVAYLIYFTKRIFDAGATAVALHMTIATIITTILHSIYDFWTIPGEETNVVFNFSFLALLAWSYLFSVIYYGYVALERANTSTEVAP